MPRKISFDSEVGNFGWVDLNKASSRVKSSFEVNSVRYFSGFIDQVGLQFRVFHVK